MLGRLEGLNSSSRYLAVCADWYLSWDCQLDSVFSSMWAALSGCFHLLPLWQRVCAQRPFSHACLFVTLWTAVSQAPLSMGCHVFLQGVFPTQGSNLSLFWLLHCRQILYHWATGEAKEVKAAYLFRLPILYCCKEPACQCRRFKRHGFHPWVGKIPWRREWQPTPVFLLGESHRQRGLAGYSPWGHKEPDMNEELTQTHTEDTLYTCMKS